jgi:hypothetical protein
VLDVSAGENRGKCSATKTETLSVHGCNVCNSCCTSISCKAKNINSHKLWKGENCDIDNTHNFSILNVFNEDVKQNKFGVSAEGYN